ncbi:hypothetical protein [Nocardioides panacisoli]|uniref:Aminoglycoside phosphotransferase domain-containing protein n=1 Tax=Nocardioides panacisoli TaxID=627624 RepID=A0ABP7IHC8_9ACTN
MDDPGGTAVSGLGAVDHLVEQLWAPALASGDIRIQAGTPGSRHQRGGWSDVETYLALPSVGSATMLLPAANREVLARSLLNFRRLRARGPSTQRALLGWTTGAGLPLPFPTVRIQTRAPRGERPELPTERVARDLGLPRVHASLGVRTAANRKATLQLVDDAGDPVGFAKFAWDPASAAAVTREADVLARLAGGAHDLRTPRLLARGSWHGHPYLVSEPLPSGARRPDPAVLPRAQELFALCPIVRHDTVDRTGQLVALRRRIETLQEAGAETGLLARAVDLLDRIDRIDVPVAARWHGDLTAWNCARDDQQRLWCWDWESTEADAVAGLDAVHWAATDLTLRGHRYGGAVLAAAAEKAAPLLTAAGHSRTTRAAVPVLYVAILVERAVALAVGNGGWDEGWLSQSEAFELVRAAGAMVPALRDSRVDQH